MGEPFDPYYVWLSIPPADQPPNHYRLLALNLFEANADVISGAADRQMAHLRTFQAGKHSAESQRLLNEVAAARVCLLSPEKKAAYDAILRESLAAASASEPASSDERIPEDLSALLASSSELPAHRRPQTKAASGFHPMVIGVAVAAAVTLAGMLIWLFGGSQKQEVVRRDTRPPPAPTTEHRPPRPSPEGVTPPPASPAPLPSPPHPDPVPAAVKTATVAPATPSPPVPAAGPKKNAEPAPSPEKQEAAAAGEAPGRVNAPLTQDPQSEKRDPQSQVRNPIPPDSAIAQALQQAEEIFRGEYEKANDAAARTVLAKKILQNAAQIKSDAASRLVFLRLARDVAIKAGDLSTAFEAIDRMGEAFEVDPWEMKVGIVTASSKQVRKPAERKVFAQRCLDLAQQAMEAEALSWAENLAKLAQAEGQRAKDKDVVTQARAAIKQARASADTLADVVGATKTLQQNPDDTGANLLVGRYRCFLKGDWTKGLPLLAKGSDAGLKQLAAQELELSRGTLPTGEVAVALGDGWWNLAQNAEGKAKENVLRHAGDWYKQAGTIDAEVVRIRVEKRLAQIGSLGSPASAPMAARGRKVRAWDPAAVIPLGVLAKFKDRPSSLAFSPDSTLLVVGAEMSAKVFDVRVGRLVGSLPCDAEKVGSMAFSPDGSLLAVRCGDSTIRFWSFPKGQVGRTINAAPAKLQSIAFSPDGILVAAEADDDTIKLWKVSTGEVFRVFKGHRMVPDHVGFIPDRSIAFSPNSALLASGGANRVIKIWDIGKGELRNSLPGHDHSFVESVCFSSNGAVLVSGSIDMTVRLWDVSQGTLKRKLQGTKSVHCVAISPDDGALASGHYDEMIRLWDVGSGELRNTLGGHNGKGYVSRLAFSPDGSVLASASYGGEVRLWGNGRR